MLPLLPGAPSVSFLPSSLILLFSLLLYFSPFIFLSSSISLSNSQSCCLLSFSNPSGEEKGWLERKPGVLFFSGRLSKKRSESEAEGFAWDRCRGRGFGLMCLCADKASVTITTGWRRPCVPSPGRQLAVWETGLGGTSGVFVRPHPGLGGFRHPHPEHGLRPSQTWWS